VKGVRAMDVTAWTAELDRLVARLGPRFVRSEARQRAKAYLQGLLSPAERKNGWQLAEMLGEPTPYGIQQFLCRGAWEADALRDDLRQYVVEQMGDARPKGSRSRTARGCFAPTS